MEAALQQSHASHAEVVGQQHEEGDHRLASGGWAPIAVRMPPGSGSLRLADHSVVASAQARHLLPPLLPPSTLTIVALSPTPNLGHRSGAGYSAATTGPHTLRPLPCGDGTWAPAATMPKATRACRRFSPPEPCARVAWRPRLAVRTRPPPAPPKCNPPPLWRLPSITLLSLAALTLLPGCCGGGGGGLPCSQVRPRRAGRYGL